MNLKRLTLWILSLVTVVAFSFGTFYYLQKEIAISIDGKVFKIHTFKKTVQDVLQEAKITTGKNDRVLPALQREIEDNGTIRITRAVPVTLMADGKVYRFETIPISVRQILNQRGIVLKALDHTSKPLDYKVSYDDKIRVTRVKQVYVKRKVELGFVEEKRPDPNMERGINRLIRKGSKGLAEKTVCITYEDGKEVSRTITDNKIIKEPKSRLIAMGALSSVSRNGRTFEFDRAVVVEATAYSHTGNRTATGAYPEVGTVAVDPDVIPLGSRLYVAGYGYARAQDVGGAIQGKRIDVFMDSQGSALRWGRRTVKVYVLK